VYDVAKLAGVSTATVSFTFRRPDKVREETRAAVQAAAQRLGYVPSASARGLAAGRNGALGLFSYDYYVRGLASASTPVVEAPGSDAVSVVREGYDEGCRDFPLYVDEVQRGMELACWQRGYALMIGGPSHADDVVAPVTDIAGRVDGLAVFPQTMPREAMERIASRIPVVAVSEPPGDDRLGHVTVDNRGGLRAITTHLIREHGRRDLLFIGSLNPAEGQARFDGFRDALRAAKLRVPRRPLVPRIRLNERGRPTFDLPEDLPLPDAFVCATDDVALTVLDRLAERGVQVPGDVAVTGFDGIVAGRIVRPALTTARQPMLEIGQAVVDILVDWIAEPSRPPSVRELPVTLVLRESCGCPSRGPIWG
jgi:LacI family transcriptional regulator